jgi:hypothetical protein
MKVLIAASIFVLAAADSVRPTVGPLPPGNTEIGRLVRSRAQARYCGAIGFIDLGAATDGPAYFFRRGDGRVIGRCGGFCRSPEGRQRCRRECPPAGWRCRR